MYNSKEMFIEFRSDLFLVPTIFNLLQLTKKDLCGVVKGIISLCKLTPISKLT